MVTDFDDVIDAATKAYEFATDDPDGFSQRAFRSAVQRALNIQREEIAQAIEAKVAQPVEVYGVYTDPTPAAKAAYAAAAQTARQYGKET